MRAGTLRLAEGLTRREEETLNPILQVKDLTYTYSIGTPFEHTALDHVNFSLERGEFVGIIGHTGSGKSTLMHLRPGDSGRPGYLVR